MSDLEVSSLPLTVRYIKNGEGGCWWPSAKKDDQLHLGWKHIPSEVLKSRQLDIIEPMVRNQFENQGAATRDLNQLLTAIISPSQHIWTTIENGYLWWCTVNDEITMNPTGETNLKGHFWLSCASSWRNTAINNKLLATSDLPGGLTMTAAFQSTICKPREAAAMRRIIVGELDKEALEAAETRAAYERSLEKLIRRLSAKDFELLIDLLLARTGWVRTTAVGGAKEGVDIEAENITADELAFVQVKSSADQATLLEYIAKYEKRKENYDRMIMAIHSPIGTVKVPELATGVQLWTCEVIAKLSVKLGLGAWIETRLA
jgi:hypothetical protein